MIRTCYYVSHWPLIILQGKRGIEKQPFQLPDFIAATGIEKIRQVMHDGDFAFSIIR